MNYIDILIILVIALFTLLGYRRGLIKTVFSVATVFIALIITSLLITPFTNYMETTEYSGIIKNKVFYMIVQSDTETKEVDEVATSLGLPGFIEENIIEKGNEFIEEAKISAQEAVAESTAQIVFNALCAVVLYLAVILLINVIKYILITITKLPVLNSINKLGGGVVGLANGALIVYIALGVVMLLISMGNIAQVGEDIAKSSIGSFMYDNNILFKFISK